MSLERRDGQIFASPTHQYHRVLSGAPVAADVALPDPLTAALITAAVNCEGYRSLRVSVQITGGAAPTVTLEQHHLVRFRGDGAAEQAFYQLDRTSAPLANRQGLIAPVGGDLVYFRVSAVTGNPTKVEILVAGDAREGGDSVSSDVVGDAVKLEDGSGGTLAKIAAGSAIVIGDNALAVKDAAIGLAADAAVATDAVGTLSAKLRGLVKLTAEVLGPVLGATTGAAVVTDAAGTIQQYLRGLVSLAVSGIKVVLGADTTPKVANAPASPGAVEDVMDALSHEVTVADLTPGVTYRLTVLPWNLGVAPGAPTDFVRGVFKCAAISPGGDIANLEDGVPITSYAPEFINLPVGSTKVRVHFMRDAATPFDCVVYLSRHDA